MKQIGRQESAETIVKDIRALRGATSCPRPFARSFANISTRRCGGLARRSAEAGTTATDATRKEITAALKKER